MLDGIKAIDLCDTRTYPVKFLLIHDGEKSL